MSPNLTDLVVKIGRISKELLPKVDPTASYSDRDVMLMCAFRLLAHAEIEGFLEECAEHLRTLYATRNNANTLSKTVSLRLLASASMMDRDRDGGYPPRTIRFSSLGAKERQKAINGFLNGHGSRVLQNNGVSEKDVLKLLVPMGFELTFFDPDWLGDMSALTAARGAAAHGGWTNSGVSQQQPTPKGERGLVARALFGLRAVVREVERLESTA